MLKIKKLLSNYTKEFRYNLKLSFPVMLCMLGHTFVAFADNVMVGQLGTAELAAVSLGNSFVFIGMSLGIGFSTAITPLVAEADSSNNIKEGKNVFIHGLLLCTILSVILFGIILLLKPVMYYMEQPKEVVELAIPYLNYVALSLIPLIIFLKSKKSKRFINWFEKISSCKIGLLLGGLPLIILTIVLKRYYPTGDSSLTNLSETFFYAYFFISGILFASSKMFWANLKKFRQSHLISFIISTLLFYGYYFMPNNIVEPYLILSVRWDIWYGLCSLLGWCFVLTILGYGQVYFNKPSLWLKRMNEAIYPFYILHQTVIVVFAYYIIQLDLSISAKFSILLVSSFLIIVFIYRFFIYPFKITRILFGMKKHKNKSRKE